MTKVDRYALTDKRTDDAVVVGRYRYGVWQAPEIDMTGYVLYTVIQADLLRPDLIAYKTLGDETLWWAIMLVNKIKNPFTELVEGLVLQIPTKNAIVAAVEGEV
jgi:nucleoid-associated protein YgaU